ncbi:hypothetical protein ACHAWO_008565 [Cyclotella atomus]|uniref:Uncharacterized protein n=1 Tax=Cyclotella atomus TaxID=382360 RepID=A0ABD3PKL9_9STRA
MSSSHTSKYSSRSTPQSMSSHQRSAHPSEKSSRSADAFVQDIHSRLSRAEQDERDIQKILVPRLAKRAYHLEDGNTWGQDWLQYQKNTHPVFGFCFHHPLHPIRGPQRVIILMGSVAFGLAITNIVFLGLLNSASAGKFVNSVYNITGQVVDAQYRYTHVELETSMVFLWTVGSFLHSVFDMLIWYLSACACFRPGGITGRNSTYCQNFALYTAVLVVVGMVFVATLVVVMRLNEDNEKWTQLLPWLDDGADSNSTIFPNFTDAVMNTSQADMFAESIGTIEEVSNTTSFENSTNATGFNIPSFSIGDIFYSKEDTKYAFLVGYAVELTIALFLYYPLTSTMFFSGVLGCGRIPILGGRPFELRMLAMKNGRNQNDESSGNNV